MTPSTPSHASILFGHGSRDPLWCRPIEAVAARMQHQQPDLPVRCAYLELCPPNLATACAELIAVGAKSISITPMFLGVGRHVREDLPQLLQALRSQHPAVRFTLQTAIGEHPDILDLMARIAASSALTSTNPASY